MDYGMAGNMRVNTTEVQLQIDPAIEATRKTDIEDESQISMLELEIEDLSLELEEEKKKSSTERAEAVKLLQSLEYTERNLLSCRTTLREREQELTKAHEEIREKDEESIGAEKALMQCRQRVTELEQKIVQMGERMREQDKAHEHEIRANERVREFAKSQEQHAYHDAIEQQESPALNQMDEMLHATLEEQTRLTLQVKTLNGQVGTLTQELQRAQNEAADKVKEMDVLRSYLRGSERAKPKPKKERNDIPEPDAEMAKALRMKDTIITRYTHQIEELQSKAKRVPQLASQVSKLEASNALLKSQRAALVEDLQASTKAFKEMETEMRDNISALESELLSLDAEMTAKHSKYEKKIARLEKTQDDLGKEMNAANRRAEAAESQNAALQSDLKQSIVMSKWVPAVDPSLLGIVFCVDLSGSLVGVPAQLAKSAFRELILALLSGAPTAHVGVVIHASSVYVARKIIQVDSYTPALLDPVACVGNEDYAQAFTQVQSVLSYFKASYPGARRRVILISDGQDFMPAADVSGLTADEVPCHNIVIPGGYPDSSKGTERYSLATRGGNFTYDGNFGPGNNVDAASILFLASSY